MEHAHQRAHAREQLLADLGSETRELTDLVNELVELATDERDDEPRRQVRLADGMRCPAMAKGRQWNGRATLPTGACLLLR